MVDVAGLPENLQLKIMGLVVGPPPVAPAAPAPPAAAAAPADADCADADCAGLLSRYAAHGYGWQDGFVAPSTTAELRRLCESAAPALTQAGVSSKDTHRTDQAARGDSTAWVPLRAPPRPRVVRVGVLGSTRGSSLQPILDALGAAELGGIEISLVISNKKDAGILQRAAQHGLPWRHVPCKKGTPRAEYDAVVTSHLEAAGCEMLLLIGFMRIVSPEFCARWDHRALNVHPSLLPAHAGGMDLEVHQAVVDAKEASSGCTVHFVEAEVDGGAICVQKSCPVLPDDTAETLKARVQPLEGPALIEATLKVAQFCRDADAPPADAAPAEAEAAAPTEAAAAVAAVAASSAWGELSGAVASLVDAHNAAAAARGGERLRLPDKLMVAHYPAGARYVAHADASLSVPHRRLAAILYLNEGWEAAHGGQLSLTPPGSGGAAVEVAPHGGRLLAFHAALTHEVLETARPRWAITAFLSAEAPSALPPPPPNPLPPPPAGPAPPPDVCAADAGAATIFVSIAAYRDPEAPHTIADLFAKAAHPSRIFVGACFQCGDGDDDAACVDLSGLKPEWAANVRTLRLHWKEARGPAWARALIQAKLYSGEGYVLQIDSHSRAAAGWDASLLDMLKRCGSPRPVLSTYPLPYEDAGAAAALSDETRPTLLCTQPAAKAYDADGMLRFRARLLSRPPVAPVAGAFWAAGFSFSPASVIADAPYDPHLPFLFFGEEVSMAARMWTRGYDLYAPDAPVLYHRYERNYRSTFWEGAATLDDAAALKVASQARVRRLLAGEPLVPPPPPADASSTAAAVPATVPSEYAALWPAADAAVWGLGAVRTLAEYEAMSGVSFAKKAVAGRAERGGLRKDEFYDRFADLEAMLAARDAA